MASAPERQDAATVDARAVARTSPDASRDAPPSGTTVSGCVLDVGGGRKGERTEISKDGVLRIVHEVTRCWLEADCIREQGRNTPGDATVSIDCRGKHCVCTFESFMPAKRIKFSFDVEEPCDDMHLKSLLLDRCVNEGRRRSIPGRR
jgi:hypothetical protein